MQRVQVGGTIGGEHRKQQMAEVSWGWSVMLGVAACRDLPEACQ